MSRRRREALGDWLTILGALALFASLFLTWSHQFSAAFLSRSVGSDLLRGVPHDPTAWQLYSAVDVLLALLAGALVAVALVGNRVARMVAMPAAAVGLAFSLHALSRPPTNGANLFDPSLGVPAYASSSPTAGVGETVAIAGLGLALVGLLLSLSAD